MKKTNGINKVKIGDLVIVSWEDASGVSEWLTHEEAMEYKPSPTNTVGWIISKEKTHITLACTINLDQIAKSDYSELVCLPIGMITKIELIREK